MRLAVKQARGPWAEQRGAAAAGANLAARSAAGWPHKHSLPLAAATASATSANCTQLPQDGRGAGADGADERPCAGAGGVHC